MATVVGLLSDSHSRWERTKRAIEALRTYLRRKDAKVKDLMHFARINRVHAVMAPYLESTL
jgi:hypothetical protein